MHLSFRASDEMVQYIDYLVKINIVVSRSEFIRRCIHDGISKTMHFTNQLVDNNRDLDIMTKKIDAKIKWAKEHQPEKVVSNLPICTECNKPIEDNEYSEHLMIYNHNIMHLSCYKKIEKKRIRN